MSKTQKSTESGRAADADTVKLELTMPEMKRGLSADEIEGQIERAVRAVEFSVCGTIFYLHDLDRRGGHRALGFARIEDYAERRLGLRPLMTRAYLAAGRALDGLPELERAFYSGRLSWPHTHELIRIATPETEAEWIERARECNVQELAAEIKGKRKGDRPDDPSDDRTRETGITVSGQLDAAHFEIWNRARARIEAATNRPWSNEELLSLAAKRMVEAPLEEVLRAASMC